jgi:bifunctional UDP-N-acetylglucosamine pyrophosphorylase/glucosamine-1-phosphate N-acetyltransferase
MSQSNSQPLDVIILAAGKGTRMYSDTPKVLHRVAGKPMLEHVISSARTLQAERIHVVVGYEAQKIKDCLVGAPVTWALQDQQLGTGHAVMQAMPNIPTESIALVLYGDVPLTSVQTLQSLLEKTARNSLAILTCLSDNPTGLGRIIRDQKNKPIAIVEEKDATLEQRKIKETNSGILAAPADKLSEWIGKLKTENAQGEYYLTDIIAMAVADGTDVNAVIATDEKEVLGVNNRQQLAILERHYQKQQAQSLLLAGVTIADPDRIDIRGTIACGRDVEIDINCIFEGDVRIGDRVTIESNVYIKNAVIGNDTVIHANSHLEGVEVGNRCQVGPFARLRLGTKLYDQAKIGNFVETKKAQIGQGSKVNHLSYIGDAELGSAVNIGAGTITCNYDGVNKFKTIIADGVFVGSNSALVAPITLGQNSTIGAGSTITSSVADNTLAISRAKQRTIEGWKRPVKK